MVFSRANVWVHYLLLALLFITVILFISGPVYSAEIHKIFDETKKAAVSDEKPVEGKDIYPDAPDKEFPAEETEFFRGRAVSVEATDLEEEYQEFFSATQMVEIEVTSGPLEGELIEIENIITGQEQFDVEVEEGQEIILTAQSHNGELGEIHIHDIARDRYIYYALAVFLILMVLVGGTTGLKTILTLIFTIFMIVQVLLPLTLRGYNPLILGILVSAFIAIVTLAVIGGLGKKTLVAIIGTVGGVIFAGILALVAGGQAHLTGLSTEEAQMLQFADVTAVDPQGILFAGIIIGALGAVMDIGMSISSACHEMAEMNPRATRHQMVKGGLNVGRDVMGTMANTLILAYVGSALPLLMLLKLYEMPFLQLINMDLIATEIIRALAGSVGLILVIPFTAFAAGQFFVKYKRRQRGE